MDVLPAKKTDEELIHELQEGRKEAFDEIVDRFSGPLNNFIYRIVGDGVTSQDLLQETFIRLWTNRHSYREIAKFSTWLYTVAGNLAKSELRRKKVRRFFSLSVSGERSLDGEDDRTLELPDEDADPEGDYERRQILKRVEEEVKKLPFLFREVIILRDLQELSYEEISTILKIPLGTVKSRVNRARLRLQIKLMDLR